MSSDKFSLRRYFFVAVLIGVGFFLIATTIQPGPNKVGQRTENWAGQTCRLVRGCYHPEWFGLGLAVLFLAYLLHSRKLRLPDEPDERGQAIDDLKRVQQELVVAFNRSDLGMNFMHLHPVIHGAILEEAVAMGVEQAVSNFLEIAETIEQRGDLSEGEKAQALKEVYKQRQEKVHKLAREYLERDSV